jgi:hypothetical protein
VDDESGFLWTPTLLTFDRYVLYTIESYVQRLNKSKRNFIRRQGCLRSSSVFSGYKTSVWAKFQLEILSSSFAENPMLIGQKSFKPPETKQKQTFSIVIVTDWMALIPIFLRFPVYVWTIIVLQITPIKVSCGYLFFIGNCWTRKGYGPHLFGKIKVLNFDLKFCLHQGLNQTTLSTKFQNFRADYLRDMNFFKISIKKRLYANILISRR